MVVSLAIGSDWMSNESHCTMRWILLSSLTDTDMARPQRPCQSIVHLRCGLEFVADALRMNTAAFRGQRVHGIRQDRLHGLRNRPFVTNSTGQLKNRSVICQSDSDKLISFDPAGPEAGERISGCTALQ